MHKERNAIPYGIKPLEPEEAELVDGEINRHSQ